MNHRPILADFIADGDTNNPAFLQIDISGILLDILGDDEELVLAFAYEPHQFDELFSELERHPDVGCVVSFDGDFDLAHYLNDQLSRASSDEDIIAAWRHWHAEAMNARHPEAWAKMRWGAIADNMRIQLAENTAKMHPLALVPLMTHILESPAGMIALRAAIAGAPTGMIDALKVARDLEEAAGAQAV